MSAEAAQGVRAAAGTVPMIVAAAHEIADGERVFVGMRLPVVAFELARRTHARRAVALYENGIVRHHPAAAPLVTMGDSPNLRGASQLGDLQGVMALLQQGRVDLGFLGAGEVDRFGNLNSTVVEGEGGGGALRLPGSGGAADIACLARRTVIVLKHERRRFRERVHYVTGPGHRPGPEEPPGWRARVGLAGGGPAAIITDLGVLRFGEDGEAYLASVHPGVTVEEVRARTGWALRVPEAVPETAPPSAHERNLLAEIDPGGFWTGEA